MASLFRKEAIKDKKSKLEGDVLLTPSLSLQAITFTLVVLVFSIMLWLSLSSYSRKETAKGWLVLSQGVSNVYTTGLDVKGSYVSRVFVNDGDIVNEGDPLLEISMGRKVVDGKDFNEYFLNEYVLEIESLTNQSKELKELYEDDEKQLQNDSRHNNSLLTVLQDRDIALKQQYEILKTRADNNSKLADSGTLSRESLEQDIFRLLDLKLKIQELKKENIELVKNKETLGIQLHALMLKHKNSIHNINQKINELERERVTIKANNLYTLKASRKGRVTALMAKQGAGVDNKIPMLSIVPNQARMIAYVVAPTNAIAYINVGQVVKMKFDAFPYQKYGHHIGNVEYISERAALPEELDSFPVDTRLGYLVVIKLSSEYFNAFGKKHKLKPGMTFDADIILESRTFLEWMFEPIITLRESI